jgi:hypothetical protein
LSTSEGGTSDTYCKIIVIDDSKWNGRTSPFMVMEVNDVNRILLTLAFNLKEGNEYVEWI